MNYALEPQAVTRNGIHQLESHLSHSPGQRIITRGLEWTRAYMVHLPGAGYLGTLLLPLPGSPGDPQPKGVPLAPGHARRGKEPVCEEECKAFLLSSSSSQPLLQAFPIHPHYLLFVRREERGISLQTLPLDLIPWGHSGLWPELPQMGTPVHSQPWPEVSQPQSLYFNAATRNIHSFGFN